MLLIYHITKNLFVINRPLPDVRPALHPPLRPLHGGGLRPHLGLALRVAVVLHGAVPHHRHRTGLHLHPRPHVPRQVIISREN